MMKLWIALILLEHFCCNSLPVPKCMVDLTHLFNNDTLYFPTEKKLEIYVVQNGTVDNEYWLQEDEYSSSTHVGTHLDGPCHFAPGRWAIHQIPLNRLIAPVIVVDIESKAEKNSDYEVTVNDFLEWETATHKTLNDVVVLIRSGWSKRWGDRKNFTGTAGFDLNQMHFPAVSPEASQWLVDNRNIYGLGTETLSPDPKAEYRTHTILLGSNIYILENVANVDKLPIHGATLHVMPMNLENTSGAPARIIATFESDHCSDEADSLVNENRKPKKKKFLIKKI